MTKKEALVRLVAGMIGDSGRDGTHEAYVKDALAFLAEIEKACGEDSGRPRVWFTPMDLAAHVREAVAAQREKDAEIAESHNYGIRVQPDEVTRDIASWIRAGGES